jgi:asparagine synthase (glutamine-hydrolysing)
MSGIAGVIADDDPTLIKDILKRMEHRGSEKQNIFHFKDAVLGCTMMKQRKHQNENNQIAIADGRVLFTFSNNEDGVKNDDNLLQLYNKYGKDCLKYLNGPFVLAIADDNDIFLARDPLGLKPLYYSEIDNKFLFASEIKGLAPFTKNIRQFPPGYYYHSREGFNQYFNGLKHDNRVTSKEKTSKKIQHLLVEAVERRTLDIDNLGIYLSGGIDSSAIVAAASRVRDDIKTFAVGTDGSKDLNKARIVANYIGTDHYEYHYNPAEIIKAIPEVIFQLESFDQYLVRSSVANYFVSRLASEHQVDLVLCGEGGDELFGGYHYLKDFKDNKSIRQELENLTMAGHANGFQRVDRINMANSLLYDMPFMDRNVWEYAFNIPVKWKIYGDKQVEKWILRKAFEDDLPEEIIWRKKEKFFKGSNTTDVIKAHTQKNISNAEFTREKNPGQNLVLRSKEELYYYRIFHHYYPQKSILKTIGRTMTVN